MSGAYRHWRYPAWRHPLAHDLPPRLSGMPALAPVPTVPHAGGMEGERPPEDLLGPEEGQEQRRVYPPGEVQARLEVSASGLRRLAGIYERTVGPLPRDERGRVWPEDAVEALEDARTMVRESRAVSTEAALRGQELEQNAEPYPATQRPSRGDIDPAAVILQELRALRALVEEQNTRIAELEKAVRTGRELEAPVAQTSTESPAGENHAGPPETVTGLDPEAGQGQGDTNPWRRVLAWFGFGVRRGR